MSNFPYKNPISSIQVNGPQSVPRNNTYGTTFSVNNTGGYMEVFSLSDLYYTIPSGTTGSIEYSGNTIPIEFTKGTGAAWSPNVITLASDNISSGRRRLGMLVYVYEEDQVYQYYINNYETLFSAATASTGCVQISDFGTTINNKTAAGQSFINAWTGNTIEDVSGATHATAVWRKFSSGSSSGGTSGTSLYIVGVGVNSTVRCGVNNTAKGDYGASLGGSGNTASANYSFVGGGYGNSSSGIYSFIGGGNCNTASGSTATISGGYCNINGGDSSFIGAGRCNTMSVSGGIIGGGSTNTISSNYSVIGGGVGNTVSGYISFVGGGSSNTASGGNSTVSGGYFNTASSTYSTVGGGRGNTASGCYSFIGGGSGNTASGTYSFIGGGFSNTAPTGKGISYQTISGGYCNTASGSRSTVGGGRQNTSSGLYSTVSGGYCNTSSGGYSTIGGGKLNCSSGSFSSVVGGSGNTVSGLYSGAIGCGLNATANCTFYTNNFCSCGSIYSSSLSSGQAVCSSTNGLLTNYTAVNPVIIQGSCTTSSIRCGVGNSATADYSASLAGTSNTASGLSSVVVGGFFNNTNSSYSFVGAGSLNKVCSSSSSVVGGFSNTACGIGSFIGGGTLNLTSGTTASIVGGGFNTAGGACSFIGGGNLNTITSGGTFSIIGSGVRNTISGNHGSVLGGSGNTVTGSFSSAIGCGLNASANCTLYTNNILTGSFSATTMIIGASQAPSLYTTTRVSPITASTGTTIYSFLTTDYTSSFVDYYVSGSTGLRAGNIMAIWSGSSVNFTETSTNDLGSTTPLTFGYVISGSSAVLRASASTGTWIVESIVRGL